MRVSISRQEQKHNRQHAVMARKLTETRRAIASNDPARIAKALKNGENENRTLQRFELKLEWGMDNGKEDIAVWQEVKAIWETL